MDSLKAVSTFSQTLSSISSYDALNQYVLVPKQFERVFNVIVDARDFEVDYAATTATPFGKEALLLAIAQGDIIPNPDYFGARRSTKDIAVASVSSASGAVSRTGYPAGREPNNVNNYVARAKNQSDASIDKYYVTIETFDEGGPSSTTLPSTVKIRTNS